MKLDLDGVIVEGLRASRHSLDYYKIQSLAHTAVTKFTFAIEQKHTLTFPAEPQPAAAIGGDAPA